LPSRGLRYLRHVGAMSWSARRRGCNRGRWPCTICGRPHGKHFLGASNDLVGCGHMSGLTDAARMSAGLDEVRRPGSLSVERAFQLVVSWRVVPGLRWRPCRSSRLVALAKLEPLNLLSVGTFFAAMSGFLMPSQTSRCGSFRRCSSSPRGSGPTCWPPPP